MQNIHFIRRGLGKKILLLHGLAGSCRSWEPILDSLARDHEVIALDLPGWGDSPALIGETSVETLADAITEFLQENGLTGIDVVGSSLGARLVLELARRGGVIGAAVALAPTGFWEGWERKVFYDSTYVSINVLRTFQPFLRGIVYNRLSRFLILSRLSARPKTIPPEVLLTSLQSSVASPVFDELLFQLAYGEVQKDAPLGSITRRLVIGWGRQDHVCFPRQAVRAIEKFPDAELHWFEECGHYPHWEQPDETVRVILDAVKPEIEKGPSEKSEGPFLRTARTG